ncbi:MAG TPA: prolyl oligopeptidase family serine peptidase [Anaerolineaceae bacterium]|nr:prolyl oligopeptidase family serine peptidase [Anaerolineaceae bacterium]HPN53670.1 prolyl oligopeptidase family serine peptidase [Anaerolineaceae bacterium]
MSEKTQLPFGLWPSPVTPQMLAQRVRLDELAWDSDGETLVWMEGQGDRNALVMRAAGEAPRELTEEQAVRGGVGYGGGEFTVKDGTLIFAEKNGRLYRRSLGWGQPRPLTPAFGAAAAPQLSPDGKWVVYVHTYENNDCLALVDSEGRNWPARLASGADFYMQPVWHPGGTRLAWIEWDHPNMPWDGCRLMLADFDAAGQCLAHVQQVDGGADESVFQPAFSPDGLWLSYIAPDGDLEKLVLLNLEDGQRRELVRGKVLSTPGWVQGLHTYGWSGSSQRLFYLVNDRGFTSLWVVDVDSGQSQKIDSGAYTNLGQLAVSPKADRLAMQASGSRIPVRLVTWEGGRWRVEKRSDGENLDPEDLPDVQPVEWTAENGMTVYGLFYAPASRRFASSGLPPAMVQIHGGPTSQTEAGYSAQAAYFTSRGYAYLAVNYRGSTGFGKRYRDALRGQWGVADVEDAAGGARSLVERKWADGEKLAIMGGSAGGYTVLASLIRYPGLFKVGICSYGVSNLFDLARDTHKFEARYLDSLVGPLPEAAALYRQRSPLFALDQIKDSLAIFHGTEDRVVPIAQSEAIVNSLRRRGVAHHYRTFEGEGHGFRKLENVITYYREMEQFLQQNLLYR